MLAEEKLEPIRALTAFGLEQAELTPVDGGLINRTFVAKTQAGEKFILQWVSPIFSPGIHDDIEVVTQHIELKGLKTPRLVPTRSGEMYADLDGAIWRVMTFIEGRTLHHLDSPKLAREAGLLLARFHAALRDLDHPFRNARLGVHDTARHLGNLGSALIDKRDHARYSLIAPLGQEILGLAAELPKLAPVQDRIVHGDPKISNILFDLASDRALCLVDLDTLARMPVHLELGDAFRSWCNPSGEDVTDVHFSFPLFEAAIEGYAAAAEIAAVECENIVTATVTIMVELAARFCADALNECYFGWDSSRFASRSEHNQVRAAGQLALARSLLGERARADAIVAKAFDRGNS